MNQKQLIISGVIVVVAAVVTATGSRADDFEDLFNDDTFADIEVDADIPEPSTFSRSHRVELQSVLNYDSDKNTAVEKRYSGLTGLALSYQPSFQYQPNDVFSFSGEFTLTADSIYTLRDNEDWGDDVIDAHQFQYDIHELIAQARLGHWQVSTGVQRVALGMADVLSVSNRLYAQNLSQPGMTEIDDTWIPAWTTAVSGSLGHVRLKAGSVHAHQLMDIPPTGSDFDTGIISLLDRFDLDYETEKFALKNMGWFVSFSGIAGALDWQLNGISQLSHTPVIDLTMITAPIAAPIPTDVVYPRENTIALAASYLTGSVLWKTEAALIDGNQAVVSKGTSLSLTDYQQLAATAGLDYNPANLGRFVAELQLKRILDYNNLELFENDSEPQKHTAQWALMYSQTFLREQLDISAQMMAFGINANGGRMQSIRAEYDWSDHWQTGIRLVDFVEGNNSLLTGSDDRDRIIFSVAFQH